MALETCDRSYYHFIPSAAAAGIFAAMFGILAAGHMFRMIQSRQWFMAAIVVGSAFEIGGFAIRATGSSDTCTLGPFVMQYLLILLAPSVFSATIYMILGRTIRAVRGEALSPIRPTWLTKIFVAGDVTCFLVQMGGGGMLASAQDDKAKADLGKYIVLTGLVLQFILFAVFIVVAHTFCTRLRKQPTEMSRRPEIGWLTMLYVLCGVSLLIMLRNLFRVIEYASGRDGYLLTHEWPLYVFDAALMLAVVGILLWWFPTSIRPPNFYMVDTLESEASLTKGGHASHKHLSGDFPSPLPSRHGC